MTNDTKIMYNNNQITLEQFNEIKSKLKKQKGIKLVEVNPGVYKTRLLG